METLFERGLVLPAQAVEKRNIQQLARHSIVRSLGSGISN
jgi:hypothetical protein